MLNSYWKYLNPLTIKHQSVRTLHFKCLLQKALAICYVSFHRQSSSKYFCDSATCGYVIETFLLLKYKKKVFIWMCWHPNRGKVFSVVLRKTVNSKIAFILTYVRRLLLRKNRLISSSEIHFMATEHCTSFCKWPSQARAQRIAVFNQHTIKFT